MTPVDPTIVSLITEVKTASNISLLGESKADKLEKLTKYVNTKLEELRTTTNLNTTTKELKYIITQINEADILVPKGLASVFEIFFPNQTTLMFNLNSIINDRVKSPIDRQIQENLYKDFKALGELTVQDSTNEISNVLSRILQSKKFLEASPQKHAFSFILNLKPEHKSSIQLIQDWAKEELKKHPDKKREEQLTTIKNNCTNLLSPPETKSETAKKSQRRKKQTSGSAKPEPTDTQGGPAAPKQASDREKPHPPKAKKYEGDYDWGSTSAQTPARPPQAPPASAKKKATPFRAAESTAKPKADQSRETSGAARPQTAGAQKVKKEPEIPKGNDIRSFLGLSSRATLAEVKTARKEALRMYHPDKILNQYAEEIGKKGTEKQTLKSQLTTEEATELERRLEYGTNYIAKLTTLLVE